MRRTCITTALAIGLLALGAPSARATGESSYEGHCSFGTLDDTTPGGLLGGQNHWVGYVDAAVALYSPTHNNVVGATVRCDVRVNGVTQVSVAGSGLGAVVFASPVEFAAEITDVVELCTVVDYTTDPTPTTDRCQGATTTEFPPQGTIDLINFVLDAATWAVRSADLPICAALRALAPGSDPVFITPEGDVYLFGEWFWDCPPYEYPVDPPVDPNAPVHGPTGGGYDDGDTGFLALATPETTTVGVPPAETYDVASVCAFRTDRALGTVTVTGATVAGRPPVADSVAIHCRLTDATTGAVVYDHTETASGPLVSWHDTVPATAGPLTVCTEGIGVWGTRTVTVGPYCRPGKAI